MKSIRYFKKYEVVLWFTSVMMVAISYLVFDRTNILTLFASLIGVTSLTFNAKGNPLGQLLMVIFSILYGIISYTFKYYGEMITYLGMTMPMAMVALAAWLRNPYEGNRAEVAVNELTYKEGVFAFGLTLIVTTIFYWILKTFQTAHLLLSTLSVATSFLAVYLTYRRSACFALAYAANDIVLILLWVLAARFEPSYWSVVVCFAAFLLNDLYGYLNWCKMGQKQKRTGLHKQIKEDTIIS